jgi:hypothetical protein
MILKPNLIEHFDFEAVSPAVWRYIYSWYSADWCIMRQIKRDRTAGGILDLYPENNNNNGLANIYGAQAPVIIDQTDEESLEMGFSGTLNRVKTFEY